MLGLQRELPTVLLIDDDLVSREVTATILTMNGFTVHTADSGPASLRLLAAGLCAPEMILMDAQMPELSGTELVKELRSQCGRASIYAISGSQPAQAIVSAVDGFLLKPFGAEALRSLMGGDSAQRPRSYLDAGAAVINPDMLAQFRRMMPEAAVEEIYTTVASDLNQRLVTLRRAIARGDRAEIRRIGHTIKGGCGMAGVEQVARLGALLEAMPEAMPGSGQDNHQDNHLDNSRALLRDLRAAGRELERILDVEFPA